MIFVSEDHLKALYKDCGGLFNQQACILTEELSELSKELMKAVRYYNESRRIYLGDEEHYIPNNRESILEEMAHVYICIAAVAKQMNVSDEEIEKYIRYKENRNDS